MASHRLGTRPYLAGTSSLTRAPFCIYRPTHALTLREKNEEPGGAQELTCSPSTLWSHRRYPDSRRAGPSRQTHTPGRLTDLGAHLALHPSQATLAQDLSERLLRESCSNSHSSAFPSP